MNVKLSRLFSISAITLTFYASPNETDFGLKPTEEIKYTIPGDSKVYTSTFVKGFASRFAVDPLNSNLSGVCMEGAGFVSINLHQNDQQLKAFYQKGLTTLNLENYDETTHTCTYQLGHAPLSASGSELLIGKSAAVKEGNQVFPVNRWVKIYRDGKFFSYRFIDDSCSSCTTDNHIDIFEDSTTQNLPAGKYSAELMPVGFYLH